MREETGFQNGTAAATDDVAPAFCRDQGLDDVAGMARSMRPLKIAAHPVRLKMVLVIGDAEVSVQDIAARLGIDASTASHHLALLGDNGIVDSRRGGNRIFYRVSDPAIRQVIHLACAMAAPS